MKTLKCDLCDHEAQGETFEDWMRALMPHYMDKHADGMKDPAKGEQERESGGWQKIERGLMPHNPF